MFISQFLFGKKLIILSYLDNTKNNLLRAVIPPSKGNELIQNIGNKLKYYIDWCGSLYWIEVHSKKNAKITEIKKINYRTWWIFNYC